MGADSDLKVAFHQALGLGNVANADGVTVSVFNAG